MFQIIQLIDIDEYVINISYIMGVRQIFLNYNVIHFLDLRVSNVRSRVSAMLQVSTATGVSYQSFVDTI